ncbi:hypothetical protein RRG08_048867 [Elysia crispata]|uniref:Uncharacterized protein n=1 Tax=Elysia crispata TaxID=231223 RepID=A0AAE0ZGV1_9GAST|nr:hypothetical protein RRG08_048867 [Elysia crispata]
MKYFIRTACDQRDRANCRIVSKSRLPLTRSSTILSKRRVACLAASTTICEQKSVARLDVFLKFPDGNHTDNTLPVAGLKRFIDSVFTQLSCNGENSHSKTECPAFMSEPSLALRVSLAPLQARHEQEPLRGPSQARSYPPGDSYPGSGSVDQFVLVQLQTDRVEMWFAEIFHRA